nr:dehydrogenase [Spirosomataceae bacterium]
DAVLNPEKAKSKKILRLIPEQFSIKSEQSLYSRIQAVVDFISGMTDLYAVDLYRKMTGMQIPQIR